MKPYELLTHYPEWQRTKRNAQVAGVLTLALALMPLSPAPKWVRLVSPFIALPLGYWQQEECRRETRLWRRVQSQEAMSETAAYAEYAKLFSPVVAALPAAGDEQPNYYDWQDAPDEAVGFFIAGNSGSGKSSVATYLVGLLTQQEPAKALVLDPHYNDVWEQGGIQSVGRISQIEVIMNWAIEELDRRCELKGQKQPLGDPIILVADEINACLERFKSPDKIESALRRLGSEGRKFNIILVAINQSENAKDIGVSAKYRNNYFVVLLGTAAEDGAEQKWKRDNPNRKAIDSAAYPCLVCGSVKTKVAVHPTHGVYPAYRKKGLPPQNLIPIRQIEWNWQQEILGIPSDEEAAEEGNEGRNGSNPCASRSEIVLSLNTLLSKESADLVPTEPIPAKYLHCEEIYPVEQERTWIGYYQENIRFKEELVRFVWLSSPVSNNEYIKRGNSRDWKRASKKICQIASQISITEGWVNAGLQD